MKDGSLEVDVNHPIPDAFVSYTELQLLAMYCFCRSKKSEKIYMILAQKIHCRQNMACVLVPLVFGMVLFFPIRWYWNMFIWLVLSSIFIAVVRFVIVRTDNLVQFHPPMAIDPIQRTITFWRKRNLACFQIKGRQQKFLFSEIRKIKILHTYSLRNSPGDYYRVDCAMDAFILVTQAVDGSCHDHLIFISLGETIFNRISDLLNEFETIPVERQSGKWTDAYE